MAWSVVMRGWDRMNLHGRDTPRRFQFCYNRAAGPPAHAPPFLSFPSRPPPLPLSPFLMILQGIKSPFFPPRPLQREFGGLEGHIGVEHCSWAARTTLFAG
jgi:hypothetical protein